VGGAAGEHPRVQVPGHGALYRGGDTLPNTLHRHFTLPPFTAFHSVYVQEHEWVVQPVNIHEYRFQDVVPCTEAEIHSQTHYTGTSHFLLSQPFIRKLP
jgi:hypothetical protein